MDMTNIKVPKKQEEKKQVRELTELSKTDPRTIFNLLFEDGLKNQSGDGSLIDKDGSTWYTAREVMTNAEESTDTCGEWNLSINQGTVL